MAQWAGRAGWVTDKKKGQMGQFGPTRRPVQGNIELEESSKAEIKDYFCTSVVAGVLY